MKNIKDYNLDELKEEFQELGEKPYRAEQVFMWLYREKVKEFKSDERIKYFYKENTGVSDTRNYGVNQAMGEYIIFVDSDDYISKTLLRSLQCVTACKCIINKRALMLLFP